MAGSGHLKPGEKGGIVARMAALPQKGSVVEKIAVESNDPKRPKIILTLQAHIIADSLPLLQNELHR